MLTTERRATVSLCQGMDAGRLTGSGATGRLLPTLLWTAVLAAVWLLVLSGVVRGGTIYVDSRQGNDAYDGRTPTPTAFTGGPVGGDGECAGQGPGIR